MLCLSISNCQLPSHFLHLNPTVWYSILYSLYTAFKVKIFFCFFLKAFTNVGFLVFSHVEIVYNRLQGMLVEASISHYLINLGWVFPGLLNKSYPLLASSSLQILSAILRPTFDAQDTFNLLSFNIGFLSGPNVKLLYEVFINIIHHLLSLPV